MIKRDDDLVAEKVEAALAMKPPALPPVDPDHLIVEQDPLSLDAYARGLLGVLRGELQAKANYPRKAAATWLFDMYADAKLPPSPNAAALFREIVQPHPDASTLSVHPKNRKAYWAAIAFEAAHPEATEYAVAKHLRETNVLQVGTRDRRSSDPRRADADQKATEAIVRGWRKLEHYRENVLLQRDPRAWAATKKT